MKNNIEKMEKLLNEFIQKFIEILKNDRNYIIIDKIIMKIGMINPIFPQFLTISNFKPIEIKEDIEFAKRKNNIRKF